jgi:hypothetical protein
MWEHDKRIIAQVTGLLHAGPGLIAKNSIRKCGKRILKTLPWITRKSSAIFRFTQWMDFALSMPRPRRFPNA